MNRLIIRRKLFGLNTLLFLGVCTIPLYLIPSGQMQVSHWFLIIYALFFITTHGVKLSKEEYMLVLLIIFVLCREGAAVVVGADLLALKSVAYLVFSFIIFQAFRRALMDPVLVDLFRYGVIVASLVAFLGVVFMGYGSITDSGDRAVGTFNNPNQLGYFSVCIFSIVSILRMSSRISRNAYIILIVGCLFMAAASLSKAAMVTLAIASIFSGFNLARRQTGILIGGLSLLSLVVFGLYAYSSGFFDQTLVVERILNIGSQSDDSLLGRGYIPWFEHGGLALAFGMSRPGAIMQLQGPAEVHSTIASFFIYYGILGGGLFFAFIFIWVKRVWQNFRLLGVILICMPPMLVGLTHNGSRFTIFWLLLAFSFALTNEIKISASSERLPERRNLITPAAH